MGSWAVGPSQSGNAAGRWGSVMLPPSTWSQRSREVTYGDGDDALAAAEPVCDPAARALARVGDPRCRWVRKQRTDIGRARGRFIGRGLVERGARKLLRLGHDGRASDKHDGGEKGEARTKPRKPGGRWGRRAGKSPRGLHWCRVRVGWEVDGSGRYEEVMVDGSGRESAEVQSGRRGMAYRWQLGWCRRPCLDFAIHTHSLSALLVDCHSQSPT
jgi:hypothetical protein